MGMGMGLPPTYGEWALVIGYRKQAGMPIPQEIESFSCRGGKTRCGFSSRVIAVV